MEGEGTRASPRGDGNPRGVTGSCSHSRPDPCSAWTPPGVGALPQLVMKAQPHQETRPAPLQPGTAASPGHPSCGSREWEVGTLVHAGVSMHTLPPGPSPHVGAGAAGMSMVGDRKAWRAAVHGVAKSQTCLKRLSMHCFKQSQPNACRPGAGLRHSRSLLLPGRER